MGELSVALVNPRDPLLPGGGYPLYENLALAQMAAYLRQHGHPVLIVDGFAENLDDAAVAARVIAWRAGLVGFACTFQTYDEVLRIATAVRQRLPLAHLTIGSEHATYSAREILLDSPLIDSVIRGEGEETVLDLARAVATGRPLDSVAGIFFRAPDGIVENPARTSIHDLDRLPFAARDTLAHIAGSGRPIIVGILGSRGCYSKCSFCNAHDFFRLGGGKAVRRRSPQNIVDEVTELYENHLRGLLQRGADVTLYFYDATLIPPDRISKQWGREIAEGLIRRGIRIPMRAYLRADSLSDGDGELVALLKEAGLRSVFVGFDSGSNELLDAYAKGASVEQNLRTVRLLQRHGLYGIVNGFIMFGPYSTLDTLRSNVDFLVASDQALYLTMTGRMCLFPGLQLIETLRRDGLLLDRESFNSVHHYRFIDPRAGMLAAKADLSREPAVQREASLVRTVRVARAKIESLLAHQGGVEMGLQQRGEALDSHWREIGRLDARTFHRFIDLAEGVSPEEAADPACSAWPAGPFSTIKHQFLDDLDAALDRLEGCFDSYLAYAEDELRLGEALARLGVSRASLRPARRPEAQTPREAA
jgi:radical SAM superfamily enzyme YgiQ (UPF0313 family)